jgi:superfamily I DNA/RNA helicase
MATFYQVKGKQYPHVIIPNYIEGYMPSILSVTYRTRKIKKHL